MEKHRVHRLMFYNLEPKAITSISYNKANNLLAVVRSDNRIEIWDMRAAPYIQNTVLLKPQTKLAGIAWCNERLFGADLEGFVKELDLVTLKEKNSYPVHSGGPCHSIAVNRLGTHLAVGTELGFINIYEIEDNGLSLAKFIQAEKRRILSLCWDASGNYIVSSCLGSVKLHDYGSGKLIHDMKPAEKSKRKESVVWSIVVTDDLTIIGGDSSGNLNVWDGGKGICTSVIKSHLSDVLTVCLSNDQKSVFCAGIDPDIKAYDRIKMKDSTIKWVKSRNIINHTHDVTGLVQLNDGRLCSGGVDSYLSVVSTSRYFVQLYPPLMQNPTVYVAVEARYVLLRYSAHLELWHLKYVPSGVLSSQPFKKLVELYTNNKELVRCAAISNDGKFIVYSTNITTRVFRFSFDEDKPKLEPLSITDCRLDNVYNICFSKDSKKLVISDNSSEIQVFSTSSSELTFLYNILLMDSSNWGVSTVSLLATSSKGDFVAVSECNGLIGVWRKHEFLVFLPRHPLPATAIAFHPRQNILYAVYSDFKFIEYSLDLLHYTQFSKSLDSDLLEKYFAKRNLPVTNISFDHDKVGVILLHTSSFVCILNKEKINSSPGHEKKRIKLDPDSKKSPAGKKKKRNAHNPTLGTCINNLKAYFEKETNPVSEKDLAEDKGFHVYEKYQHLVHFESFGSKEMIAVEIKPRRFLEKLPPLFKKKQFGRK